MTVFCLIPFCSTRATCRCFWPSEGQCSCSLLYGGRIEHLTGSEGSLVSQWWVGSCEKYPLASLPPGAVQKVSGVIWNRSIPCLREQVREIHCRCKDHFFYKNRKRQVRRGISVGCSYGLCCEIKSDVWFPAQPLVSKLCTAELWLQPVPPWGTEAVFSFPTIVTTLTRT